MTRLSNASLKQLGADIAIPDYDRKAITPGIVHLGIGAFHRTHQAVYLDDLLAKNSDWGIIGASLRRPDTKQALDPQDGLYTLAVKDQTGTHCRVIGSILEIIDATAEGDRLIEIMADPKIRIVSLTVTEKGYCRDTSTGELDETHPDIIHDIANPNTPKSAPGFVVAALARRHKAGIAPFTVMCCDNLPHNGKVTAQIVTRLATLQNDELGAFVADKVAFPSTMVDRIAPATSEEDTAAITKQLGVEDAWPVSTEPFSQWVIEDNFPQGRPMFETVGVQMVADAQPYERMKLRMLNGSHSTLAYLGYLGGFKTIAEAIAHPDLRTLILDMMTREIVPTLDMPDTDLLGYRDSLLQRFANPALQHLTWQIAMDGTQKLPMRLLDTIRDRIAMGEPSIRLSLGVAAWIRYASGVDEQGVEIDVRDPLADRLRILGDQAGTNPDALATAFLGLKEVFGDDLPNNARFCQQVVNHLGQLLHQGALATIAMVVNGPGVEADE